VAKKKAKKINLAYRPPEVHQSVRDLGIESLAQEGGELGKVAVSLEGTDAAASLMVGGTFGPSGINVNAVSIGLGSPDAVNRNGVPDEPDVEEPGE
jgi:hypothetical protein